MGADVIKIAIDLVSFGESLVDAFESAAENGFNSFLRLDR